MPAYPIRERFKFAIDNNLYELAAHIMLFAVVKSWQRGFKGRHAAKEAEKLLFQCS